MLTEADFFSEILQLRDDLGPIRQMRVQCHRKELPGLALQLLTKIRGEPYVRLALFDLNAQHGDHPLVEVDTDPDEHLIDVESGRIVDVAGTVGVGHAVVVIIDDRQYWPRAPAAMSYHPPRL